MTQALRRLPLAPTLLLLAGFSLLACKSGHPDHTGDAEITPAATPQTASVGADSAASGDSEGGTESPADESAEPPIVHASLGPAELVRHYLTLGAAGDHSRIKDYIDPACYEGPVGRVESVRMVGVLMTLGQIEVKVESETVDSAVVGFDLRGSVVAGQSKPEKDLEGVDRPVRTSVLTADDVPRSGKLALSKQAGLWRVSCSHSFGAQAGGASGSSP